MMKRLAAGLTLPALLAGCVTAPKGVSEQDLTSFDAALASIGCELTGESDYMPMELQTGLNRETLVEVAQYRIAKEQAIGLENGGVRLITGACAPQEV